MRHSFSDVRVKFIDAMLSVHGVFNKSYLTKTFDVSYPCSGRDMANYLSATPGVFFDARDLSFRTDDSYIPMENAAEYLKAVSVVFGATDYSVPGSVSVARAFAKSETSGAK